MQRVVKELVIFFTIGRMHIAILVPFRDEIRQNRAAHLSHFLKVMPGILDSACGEHTWTILVGVQGCDGKKFMRGKLLNALASIVFMEKIKVDQFVLHDVDLIPNPDRARGYFIPLASHIRLLALNTTGEYAGLKNYIGGICAVSVRDFEAVNGFPNSIEGWGGEDDALRDRISPGNIAAFKDGSVSNLEIEATFRIEGQVRARECEEFKMLKKDRLAIRHAWRNGHGCGLLQTAFFHTETIVAPRILLYTIDLNPVAPAPWEVKVSKSSRKTYYWNPETGESTWKLK